MPFVKLDYVYKLMEQRELPYFKVTDGKVLIGKNQEESEPAKAVELLQELLEMVEDSIVTVSLGDKTDKERGKGGSNWDNYCFKVRLKTTQSEAVGINGTILSMMKENADLLRKLELQQKENEMKELRKEIQDIKDEKGKPDMLEKYLPLLAGHFAGKPGIAGADDGEVDEEKIQRQRDEANRMKKIKLAVFRLAKVDANLPDTLTMLATFAEKQPEKYKTFIPILKSQL